jgi:hypothetical protein
MSFGNMGKFNYFGTAGKKFRAVSVLRMLVTVQRRIL